MSVGLTAPNTHFDPPSEVMQTAEKRKNLRRTVTYPAFLDLGDGSPPRPCKLRDASAEGAQLAVADPNSLPDEFILALSFDGAARRRCRVMWRTDDQIGVEFLKDRKTMRPAKPAPVEVAVKPAAGPQDGEAQADQPVDRVDVDTLPPR
jgi:hypothetical protein